jgi:UPF0755 protein
MKKIILILIVLLGLGVFLAKKYWDHAVYGVANSLNEATLIEIPRGASALKIAKILQKKELIASEKVFYYYCRINRLTNQLKSGIYLIEPKLSIAQTVDYLIEGKIATKKITIPEGRASWEIFSILKPHYGNLDSNHWESLIHDSKFQHALGVKKAPSLEGYLLADTYLFPYQATEKELIEIMVRATKQVLEEFKDSDSPVLKKYGWHGVLTLASIVEEETGLPEERPRIAGVFYNRLVMGMSLGADPTVRFIFRNLTGPIYKSQLEHNSPYNTRKFRGLPPGPISNPGRAAIQAALQPMDTKDLYFVAKDDGTREHFFCSTYACHNKYKDIAARNRGE